MSGGVPCAVFRLVFTITNYRRGSHCFITLLTKFPLHPLILTDVVFAAESPRTTKSMMIRGMSEIFSFSYVRPTLSKQVYDWELFGGDESPRWNWHEIGIRYIIERQQVAFYPSYSNINRLFTISRKRPRSRHVLVLHVHRRNESYIRQDCKDANYLCGSSNHYLPLVRDEQQ